MDERTRGPWDKMLDVASELAPRQILGITVFIPLCFRLGERVKFSFAFLSSRFFFFYFVFFFVFWVFRQKADIIVL